ncbi:LysR family transcriptional regulator [Bosea sp. 685]|uniref:LysR family transcriptional regulator n=1 Tax=Bosea sp. 685 TaxID=3080057 RepID=UPI0028930AE1|nr:LysR family transcriptional regulator [Bosea sp. 685]WNJ87883.1 LysR family transcriptional regulator [Bosea sp. 685]
MLHQMEKMAKDSAKMHSWNWDDLRFVLAVAEHRTLAGAGRAMRVNHTTVLRRINAFEQSYGLRLFDRLPHGYALTDSGDELLKAANEMSTIVDNLERKLTGRDLRLEGILRITTCDTLMGSVLPGILRAFSALHPGITLEVTTGSFVTDLAQRDAHIAIRTGDDIPDRLIGRRISDVGFGIYAAMDLVEQNENVEPRAFDRWLVPDVTLGGMGISRWLNKNVPAGAVALRADSLIALRQAAQAGLGFALLPHYLGDLSPNLRRVRYSAPEFETTGLWVLTHEDLRRTARVNTFTAFASKELQRLRPIFLGAERVEEPAE